MVLEDPWQPVGDAGRRRTTRPDLRRRPVRWGLRAGHRVNAEATRGSAGAGDGARHRRTLVPTAEARVGAKGRTDRWLRARLHHGPPSHQVMALAAAGQLGMAAAGQIRPAVVTALICSRSHFHPGHDLAYLCTIQRRISAASTAGGRSGRSALPARGPNGRAGARGGLPLETSGPADAAAWRGSGWRTG
jgi:hypothetical protein